MAEPLTVSSDDVSATVFTGCSAMQRGSTQVEMIMNAEGTDFSVLLNGTEMIDKSTLSTGKYILNNYLEDKSRISNIKNLSFQLTSIADVAATTG